MIERWRWRIWRWLTKLPGVCNANAHTVLFVDRHRGLRIDSVCRDDAARKGVCWCGKLRDGACSS